MNSLKKIVYLSSDELFNTLVSQGYVDVEGKGRLLYSPDTTDYRVKYTEPTIPVKGIQINSVDQTPDANGKVNVPLVSSSAPGVVKLSTAQGIWYNSNGLQINCANDSEIAAKTNAYKPVVPSNLQIAVDVGVKGSTNYTSFTCEMASGETKTLKMYCELV